METPQLPDRRTETRAFTALQSILSRAIDSTDPKYIFANYNPRNIRLTLPSTPMFSESYEPIVGSFNQHLLERNSSLDLATTDGSYIGVTSNQHNIVRGIRLGDWTVFNVIYNGLTLGAEFENRPRRLLHPAEQNITFNQKLSPDLWREFAKIILNTSDPEVLEGLANTGAEIRDAIEANKKRIPEILEDLAAQQSFYIENGRALSPEEVTRMTAKLRQLHTAQITFSPGGPWTYHVRSSPQHACPENPEGYYLASNDTQLSSYLHLLPVQLGRYNGFVMSRHLVPRNSSTFAKVGFNLGVQIMNSLDGLTPERIEQIRHESSLISEICEQMTLAREFNNHQGYVIDISGFSQDEYIQRIGTVFRAMGRKRVLQPDDYNDLLDTFRPYFEIVNPHSPDLAEFLSELSATLVQEGHWDLNEVYQNLNNGVSIMPAFHNLSGALRWILLDKALKF